MTKKNILVYSIAQINDKEACRLLSKKKVDFVKEGISIALDDEIKLAGDSPIKVVFHKSISRKIGGKEITFTNNNKVIYTVTAPVQINKNFEVYINA